MLIDGSNNRPCLINEYTRSDACAAVTRLIILLSLVHGRSDNPVERFLLNCCYRVSQLTLRAFIQSHIKNCFTVQRKIIFQILYVIKGKLNNWVKFNQFIRKIFKYYFFTYALYTSCIDIIFYFITFFRFSKNYLLKHTSFFMLSGIMDARQSELCKIFKANWSRDTRKGRERLHREKKRCYVDRRNNLNLKEVS